MLSTGDARRNPPVEEKVETPVGTIEDVETPVWAVEDAVDGKMDGAPRSRTPPKFSSWVALPMNSSFAPLQYRLSGVTVGPIEGALLGE